MRTPEQRAHNYMLALEYEAEWQDMVDRRKEDICHRDDAVAQAIDRFVQAGLDDLVLDDILTLLAEDELHREGADELANNIDKLIRKEGWSR